MRSATTAVTLCVALALTCAAPAGEGRVGPSPGSARVGAFDHSHGALDELLRAHVRDGWVDYAALKGERAKLDGYLAGLHAVAPAELEGWTRAQRFAFWIDVYNAHVLALVLDHYPVHSIKDIGGLVFNQVWDKEFIPMRAHHPEGKDDDLSLNDVEHGILRPRFQDARVHAAVNCASYSCPPLADRAFTADRLEEMLEAQMRAFVHDPLRNRFDEESGTLRLSEIFSWFEEDFRRDAGSEGQPGTVKQYLIRFAPEQRALIEKARVKYLDYDWSLNDVEENRI